MNVGLMVDSFVFRFDASQSIGLGHAYRCMALIERINVDSSINVIVIAKQLPVFLIEKLQGINAKVHLLDKCFNVLQEIQAIDNICHKVNCHSIILDGYQFDVLFRKALCSLQFHISCFDDLNNIDQLYCDLVINALPFAHSLGYENSAPKAQGLFGLPYSIIRQEFIKAPVIKYQHRKSILVNFGGSDVLNFTLPMVKHLMDSPLVENHDIIVVTGGGFQHQAEVRTLCLMAGFEHIHNCNEMSAIMNKCKLAICAPGAIVYELAYCAVPSVFITVADNQLLSATAHQALGWCHVINGQEGNALEQAIQISELLCDDSIGLKQMSVKASLLVDGQGVERIINALTSSTY